jgi:hypothetical protein
MVERNRRGFLKTLGMTALVGSGVGTVGAQENESRTVRGRMEPLGHAQLSDPEGGYAEEAVRQDGQYAVLGSYLGEGGSFLVDLSDLSDPTEAHRLPSSERTRNADVEFDARNGLYYRSQEPNDDQGRGGVEIVDYGFEQGSVSEPEVIARIDRPSGVHNVEAHYSEPVLYLVNSPVGDLQQEVEDPQGVSEGLTAWDTSDPANPQKIGEFEPMGNNHDVTGDRNRDMLHSAYIVGDFVGYAAHDISDPRDPQLVGTFDYKYRPDYTEVGTPGFELAHFAAADPEDDLVVLGDEKGEGMPGGKHILDVGWEEGSFENPVHVGFTHGPNAMVQDEDVDLYDWTTHNHQIIRKGDTRLLVDGCYHEGAVVFDISDPTDPVPAHQYLTDEGAETAQGPTWMGAAPMAWGADYHAGRDFVAVSDMATGIYVFRPTDEEPPVLSVEEAIDANDNGQMDSDEIQQAISYWTEGETVPNTGVAGDNERMTTERLQRLIQQWKQNQ